ncbi:MAG: DUF354 domain-containing protein [Nitrososphaeraceae archaeon]
MKIWLDILTPKQMMFFEPIINYLHSDGHIILCTSRKYREATELAKIIGIEFKEIGIHGGSEKYDKLLASTERIKQLLKIIKEFSPDLTISFSSPEAARISFGLGIKHYVFNDSPHAESVARLTIPLSDKLFCPWIIPYKEWMKYGIDKRNIIKYKSLDPIMWLKREKVDTKYNESLIKKFKIDSEKKTIVIRPEESKAAYILSNKNKKINNTIKIIDKIVFKYSELCNIIIFGRYTDQIKFFKNRYSNRIKIINEIIRGTYLIKLADIFIGAGGTMSAEAALMGKPVISIAPIRFHVENYLISKGLVQKILDTNKIEKTIDKMLIVKGNYNKEKNMKKQKKQREKSIQIVEEMEDPLIVFKRIFKNP